MQQFLYQRHIYLLLGRELASSGNADRTSNSETGILARRTHTN